jgi:sialate O-acetylesterase
MIHPVAGYTIQGAIWYQGESNVSEHQYYHDLFSVMIESWREEWSQGDFPFLFVQLANYQQRYDTPTESDWAKLQEAQTQTLKLANTGMVVTVDIGAANDIHPRNKQDVGTRLWLATRHLVFNDELVYSGPQYRGHIINGSTVEIMFDHTGSGLMLKNEGKDQSFAVAGENGRFYWAKPEIKDNRIILSSSMVPNPVSVRYAWADNPNAPLYNKEGLPAIPFRTDDW